MRLSVSVDCWCLFSCNDNLSDIPDDYVSFSLREINGSQNLSVHADRFTHITCLYVAMSYAFYDVYAQTVESIGQLAYGGKKREDKIGLFLIRSLN